MSTEQPFHVNTDLSPLLHPDHLDGIDGLSPSTEHLVKTSKSLLKQIYNVLGGLKEYANAVKSDPLINESAQTIKVYEHAVKEQTKIAKAFDANLQALNNNVVKIEAELSAPLASPNSALATEIRAHAASLKAADRSAFIVEAIQNGDHETVRAVLGAPHYLSKILSTERDHHLHQYHSKNNPDLQAALKVQKSLRDALIKKAELIGPSVEKQIGFKFSAATEIQRQANKAGQLLQDALNNRTLI